MQSLLIGPLASRATTQSGKLAKAFDAWIAYELRRARFDATEVWPRNESPRVYSRELEQVAGKLANLRDALRSLDDKADEAAQRRERARNNADALTVAAQRLERLHKEETKAHEKVEADYARAVKTHVEAMKKHETKMASATEEKPYDEPPPEPPVAPGPLVLSARAPALYEIPATLRGVIGAAINAIPNTNATNILGRFYVKQVDVVVSSWDRGPDVLISGKTMFSSFGKNTKNRYEETLGEATNLRDRHPLAGMGYAFLVRDTIFKEAGAYARLQDLLLRTRKPYGPYDATMLLIATWDQDQRTLQIYDPTNYPDPRVSGQQPPVDLSAPRFFTDLLNAVITATPVGIHQAVREMRNGTPVPGGAPDLGKDAFEMAEANADDDDD